VSLALFGSTQSASFECNYVFGEWRYFGTVYYCEVQNYVSITSLEVAQIDDISGSHKTGYNNDNVEGFRVYERGQIHYFPRGLNKFFKNLKGIYIRNMTLKEIHQSDLKHFPKLQHLTLFPNKLEIIEENLLDFNLNLVYIDLDSNRISHIDPNVFDKLTKLKTLDLRSNSCINMYAVKNQTGVQEVIKSAKSRCTNSDYSNLEQKVRNLEVESKNLNSENFKEKLENLENEIKNSKFENFFQEKLQGLKAALIKHEMLEFFDTMSSIVKNNSFEMCSAFESKVDDVADNLLDLVALTSNQTNNSKVDEIFEQCTAFNDKLTVLNSTISGMEEKMSAISEAVATNNKNYEDFNKRFSNLMKALERIFL